MFEPFCLSIYLNDTHTFALVGSWMRRGDMKTGIVTAVVLHCHIYYNREHDGRSFSTIYGMKRVLCDKFVTQIRSNPQSGPVIGAEVA